MEDYEQIIDKELFERAEKKGADTDHGELGKTQTEQQGKVHIQRNLDMCRVWMYLQSHPTT